ncbi:hypothetical protein [Streptomyces sp. NPDC050263]|uniref:hypothetical protein n=1 Tax=Streptomyces sp. NPDC050263 TaxID=3155037 RepID=UPI003447D282
MPHDRAGTRRRRKDDCPVCEAMGRQTLALDPRVPVMARVNGQTLATEKLNPAGLPGCGAVARKP